MSDQNKDQLDPQIANLLGLQNKSIPDFKQLIGEEDTSIDLTVQKFRNIEKIQEDPKPWFQDRNFYKKVLVGEGELAKRLHEVLTGFLNAENPQDKSLFRSRVIPAYWDLSTSIAQKVNMGIPLQKSLFLRYGVLSPTFLDKNRRTLLSTFIFKNTTREPVYYLDEWLSRIARGQENPSATDELKVTKKDSSSKLAEKSDKTRGQRDFQINNLRNSIGHRHALEVQLHEAVQALMNHSMSPEIPGVGGPYTESQKKLFFRINDLTRKLSSNDKEIVRAFNAIQNLNKSLTTLEDRLGESETAHVDTSIIKEEFNTIRQMNKLCIGRKGNHFPILMSNYMRSNIRDIGIRENIINEMAAAEAIDPALFFRTFKNQTNRIVPNIILLPNYGESGICWEPFERRNRATSRGRIAIPLYPKNLKIAVLSALADIRWQTAKERAHHYWMEEGITGQYYQWFQSKKMKGDVRVAFINDYILWITKESTGIQKLSREVRGVFWRLIPFPQHIKDDLKNRGYVYNELYKKDINISRSDGY